MSEAPYPEEIPIVLPSPLQTLLENDCIEITQRRKVVNLPATFNVEAILKNYFAFITTQNENESINISLLVEVLDGIKTYFNFTLSDHLLYEEERCQYESLTGHMTPSHVMSNGIDDEDGSVTTEDSDNVKKSASVLYGLNHLLRLFLKLPLFLSYARVPISHVHILHNYFKDLFSYLCTNLDTFSTDKHIEQ